MLIICQLHLLKSVSGESVLQCLDAFEIFMFLDVSDSGIKFGFPVYF